MTGYYRNNVVLEEAHSCKPIIRRLVSTRVRALGTLQSKQKPPQLTLNEISEQWRQTLASNNQAGDAIGNASAGCQERDAHDNIGNAERVANNGHLKHHVSWVGQQNKHCNKKQSEMERKKRI